MEKYLEVMEGKKKVKWEFIANENILLKHEG